MNISKTRNTAAVLGIIGLAACGGGGGDAVADGGGDAPVPPTASTGFASASSSFDSTVTFTPASSNITTRTSDGVTVSESPSNIQLRFSDSGDALTMLIRGVPVQLTRSDATTYSDGIMPENRLDIIETAENGAVVLAKASDTDKRFGEDIVFAYGFDTDPAVVDAQDGSVVFYRGDLLATAVQGDTQAEAEGRMSFIVQFPSDAITGNITIGQLGDITGTTAWVLPRSEFTGNGFSADLVIDDNDGLDPDQTLQSANADGRFFGVDAGAIGGAFTATITDDTDNPIFIQGGYIADLRP